MTPNPIDHLDNSCFWLFVLLLYIPGNSYGHGGTVFPGQAWTSCLPVICAYTFICYWQQPFLNESAEGRRMTVEIISWSISSKLWDRAGIKLATPGSALRLASVARHITDCATQAGIDICFLWEKGEKQKCLSWIYFLAINMIMHVYNYVYKY